MEGMAVMLERSYQVFKITIINMLRVLMDNVDGMQKQIGNVKREMDIPRKNQK